MHVEKLALGRMERRAHSVSRSLATASPWRRAVLAKTACEARGAQAPRSRDSKLAVPGPGFQAPRLPGTARACEVTLEAIVSGVLTQSLHGYFSRIATMSLLSVCSKTQSWGTQLLIEPFGLRPKPAQPLSQLKCARLTFVGEKKSAANK